MPAGTGGKGDAQEWRPVQKLGILPAVNQRLVWNTVLGAFTRFRGFPQSIDLICL